MASLCNLSGSGLLLPNVPYDAEIEYLETGDLSCFINTGIKTKSDTQFDFDIYVPTKTQNFWLFGGRVANNNGQNAVIANNDNFGWRYGNRATNAAAFNFGRYNFSNTGAARTLKINNSSYSANSATFTTDVDFYIFTVGDKSNSAGHSTSYIGQRFYKGKMYSSGVLVRDYIPVRVGQIGYLYDKVSGTLFGNAGTCDFILGNDI